jgi:hypothetical protein
VSWHGLLSVRRQLSAARTPGLRLIMIRAPAGPGSAVTSGMIGDKPLRGPHGAVRYRSERRAVSPCWPWRVNDLEAQL